MYCLITGIIGKEERLESQEKISRLISSSELDVKKFERLLSNNDQGYKFFWLEAIMRLLPTGKESYSFDEIINEMIWEAWETVTHYHLRLGHTVGDTVENFLEHAIKILYECVKRELDNKVPSRSRVLSIIRKNEALIMPDKVHLTDYVPYRLIKPFVDSEGKNYIDKKNYSRFIAYLNLFSKQNEEFFYDIVDALNPLERKIRINERWALFMMSNYAVIMGWIQYNKALFIQDRNPGVPGVMYKVSPETEERRKSLEAARNLWMLTVKLTGKPLYEIYTGHEIDVKSFELDHFVPRSYVTNDELWNLTPISKSLNCSKGNRLPEKRFIRDFIDYHYYLFGLIFKNNDETQSRQLLTQFEHCKKNNLNSNWATERLYRTDISKDDFGILLEDNLTILYDSACLQEYEMWER